jgi:hypothetical protein
VPAGVRQQRLLAARRRARVSGALGFLTMIAVPAILFHDVVALLAAEPNWRELYYLSAWTPWFLLAVGLLFMLPVAWSAGMNPESRFFPRARAVYAGWGVSLYLLGFMLAWQVTRIQNAGLH